MSKRAPEYYDVRLTEDTWRPAWINYRGWMYDYNPETDLYHSRSSRKVFGHDIHPRSLDWFLLRGEISYSPETARE